ncbi:MAG: hypothetical protein OEV42_15055 [Deltaproteobacteria bacterium]|nr:hypothetical protein [Deltaproteobacteria bacterium]
MNTYRFYRRIALFVLLLFSLSCPLSNKQDEKGWKSVPLPVFSEGSIKLRVVYAVNPRFSRMTQEQINGLLREARAITKAHFNVDLIFDFKGETGLAELMNSRLSKEMISRANELIYDFKNHEGERYRLLENMEAQLRKKKTPLHQMFDFAGPYLIKAPKEETYRDLAVALVNTTLSRLEEWKRVKAVDGKAVIDDTFFNEYILWDMLGYGEVPYDLVLTNQLIASAEYYGQDIHSAIRGGITAGGTTYNKNSLFGSYIFFTTFLYSNEYETLLKFRDNRRYDPATAARLAGAYLSHEIGHLLFHFGHPYGKKECVMNPVELLKFHEWYGNIDAGGCKAGSNKNMKAGAISITYNPRW